MKRNKFNLSHYRLLTCKMGQLIPLTWFEVLPGDTIQHATSGLIRCAPVVTPVMHPVKVRFHHFFVPNRIMWANWQSYITGGPAGTDTTSHPYITIGAGGLGSLSDYLGWSTTVGGTQTINALPYRAYSMIWNEWFRDEDLQTPLVVSLGDGNDTTTNGTLQNVCWEKDYLTSSRPWTSKGNAVSIPLSGFSPVSGLGSTVTGTASSQTYIDSTGTSVTHQSVNSGSYLMNTLTSGSVATSNPPQVFANLGGVPIVSSGFAPGGIDPLALRHALAIERFQEARARYGSRYTEYLRYLGVKSSDARLQRPELLGSGRQTIQFSEVMQTGVTTSGTSGGAGGVGQYGGHGISAVRSNRYRRFFEEHGIVMTLMSVVPRSMYSQRSPRAWFRGISGTAYSGLNGTREDYWQKELESIGSQGVNGLEVDASVGGNVIFGYQDRYDEYRRAESTVAGQFRTILDTWHLSREFGSAPALNSTFVSCVPSTRIFADTTDDNLYCMINHSIQARRLLKKSGGQSFAR